MKWLAILLVSGLSALGATWYIDPLATGNNSGTSLANAFTNLVYADRSSGIVAPGDTVYFAGRDYTNLATLSLQEGSAVGPTWTHYRTTNGVAKLYCALALHRYTDLNFPIISGFENTISNNTFQVPWVATNCGLWLWRFTNWYNVGSGGRSIVVEGDPTIIRFVHITGALDKQATDPPYFQKSDSASEIFYDLSLGGDSASSNDLSYCYIDASSGHGAGAAISLSSFKAGFAGFNIHHNLIETNNSDIIDFSGGVDIHHNVIRTRKGLGAQGCNDTFTISGPTAYIRIWNNIIEPADNSLYYLWGSIQDIHDFYLYGNLLTPVRYNINTDPTSGLEVQNQGSGVQEQDVFTGSMYFIHSNVVFALNTMPFTTNDGVSALISLNSKNAASTGHANSFTIENGAYWIADNVAIQMDAVATPPYKAGISSLFPSSNVGGGTNDVGEGWIYSTNAIVFDYNCVSSAAPKNYQFTSWGPQSAHLTVPQFQIVATSNDCRTILGYTHNSDGPLSFVNRSQWDFRLANPPAITGTNFASTAFVQNMPDVGTDLYGNTRTNWIGAIDYRPSGLVAWYTFNQGDGWTTNGVLTDQSGSGNTGYRYQSTNHNTWPTWTNGPVVNGVGLDAARFVVNYTNPIGGYHQGTYVVVPLTNSANQSLWTFTNLTWMAWAEFDLDYALGYSGNEQVINTAQDQFNPFFGNYYSVHNTSGMQFSWPSTGAGQEPMTTTARFPNITNTSFHHYAVTWDGTTFASYYDGLPWFSSQNWTDANSFSFVTNFSGTLKLTNSVGGAFSWLSLGVNTHGNLPFPDPNGAGPNNGQLQGVIADVRLYNRALPSSDIAFIAGVGGAQDPSITQNPQNQTIALGRTAMFTVVGSGQTPLSYQWQWQGTNVTGATTATFTTPVQNATGSTTLNAIVSDAAGNITSGSAILTVIQDPQITVQPQNLSVSAGQNATFNVTATGLATLTYRWFFNGIPVGGNSSTYTRSAQLSDNGLKVQCIVTNINGSQNSALATLFVNADPNILIQPASQTVIQGNNVTFTVNASGNTALTYQWQVSINSGLSWNNTGTPSVNTLTLSAVTLGMSGNQYRVIVTDTAGPITSSAAILTVNPPPVVQNVSLSVSGPVTIGGNVTIK